MAKIHLNPIINKLHGSIANFTFRYMYGRQTLIKKPDMSNVQWSEAQQAHRRRFKRAVAYARSALADPEVRARYEADAAAQGKRPFDLAVSDYFKGRDLLNEG
ncbi:MAG: hypothetical protein C3F07_10665 [Anaerolineales bacterium]|nr:hypothetical protein [Anaerolineae bacterium]PWB72875.1 MAG: hypothetical protein C3F07_10665 [Anaerolineales bacterium]